jgi:hypothetical protein
MSSWKALLPLSICAIVTAFSTRPISTTSFGRGLPLYETAASTVDTVSPPAALAEERMLEGPQQTFLEEIAEVERNRLWKRLQKEAKAQSRSAGQGAGGFGAKTKQSNKEPSSSPENTDHSAYDPTADKKSRFGAVVMDQGVARVDGVLDKATAAVLLEYINQSLEEARNPKTDLPEEELYKQQTKFSDVLGKLNRWDMLLSLEDSEEVMQAMWELLGQNNVLSDAIKSILGPEPKLYELGTLISDPGSERQKMLHADYNFNPDFTPTVPPALTCCVALQDISPEMGPTTFIPQSATEAYHLEIRVRDATEDLSEEGLLAESPNQMNTLGTGD